MEVKKSSDSHVHCSAIYNNKCTKSPHVYNVYIDRGNVVGIQLCDAVLPFKKPVIVTTCVTLMGIVLMVKIRDHSRQILHNAICRGDQEKPAP